MKTTYQIELAVDSCEVEEFNQWLNNHGHQSKIGNSTANYVNGVCTYMDEHANTILNQFWDNYCNDEVTA
jgi:hypothetical protein